MKSGLVLWASSLALYVCFNVQGGAADLTAEPVLVSNGNKKNTDNAKTYDVQRVEWQATIQKNSLINLQTQMQNLNGKIDTLNATLVRIEGKLGTSASAYDDKKLVFLAQVISIGVSSLCGIGFFYCYQLGRRSRLP